MFSRSLTIYNGNKSSILFTGSTGMFEKKKTFSPSIFLRLLIFITQRRNDSITAIVNRKVIGKSSSIFYHGNRGSFRAFFGLRYLLHCGRLTSVVVSSMHYSCDDASLVVPSQSAVANYRYSICTFFKFLSY